MDELLIDIRLVCVCARGVATGIELSVDFVGTVVEEVVCDIKVLVGREMDCCWPPGNSVPGVLVVKGKRVEVGPAWKREARRE